MMIFVGQRLGDAKMIGTQEAALSRAKMARSDSELHIEN